MKLLLRFFLNQNLSGYLQGLSKELDENTNSIRVELNRLEEAGILSSELEGRRKLYRVNKNHPLTSDITSIIRKVTGIEQLVERIVSKLDDSLEQVWIRGDLAKGIDSKMLDVLVVGKELDKSYVAELMKKAESVINKTIIYMISPTIIEDDKSIGILVWQKQVSE